MSGNHKIRQNDALLKVTPQLAKPLYAGITKEMEDTVRDGNRTMIIESVSRDLPQGHLTLVSDLKGSSSSPFIFTLMLSVAPCPFDDKSVAPDTCIFLKHKTKRNSMSKQRKKIHI